MTLAAEMDPLHFVADAANQWRAHAACRGQSELFFPVSDGERANASCYAAAREICEQCPVVEPCLEAGLFERFGMWGGATVRERQALRRRMGLVRPSRARPVRILPGPGAVRGA